MKSRAVFDEIFGEASGARRASSGDDYGIPDTAGNLATEIAAKGRFRYTGQVWLPEVGLYYYKARMYSPTLGRFLQTDPIGYGDGMNMYRYVGNDPVNFVDPTGLKTWRDGDYVCKDTAGGLAGYEGSGSACYYNPLPNNEVSPNAPGGGGGGDGGGGGGSPQPTQPDCGAGKFFTGMDSSGNPICAWNTPLSPACPVGINERDYPIPPGYTSAGQNGNRFVLDGKGAVQINPHYAAARNNAQGADWKGIATDFVKLAAGIAFPLRNGAIEKPLAAAGIVGSSGAKGAWGVPRGECFWNPGK